VAFADPRAAAAAGIGVFYQDLSLIPRMTVAENIYLGREPCRRTGLVDRQALRVATTGALAQFGKVLGAGIDPEARITALSADQGQIVEIVKVLAANPRIVIFDEATAALDRDQVSALFARVRTLKAEGRSIIFITHRMDEVFDIADRVTVMRNGLTVLTRPCAQTTRDEVVGAMVGELSAAKAPRGRHTPSDEVALEVEDLTSDKLSGVSFKLRRGEILGVGGLHGQGQSELLRALFGAVRIQSGTVRINAKALVPKSPRAMMRYFVAYVSGDRARYGVMAIRPIFENLVISLLARERCITVARRRPKAFPPSSSG
jgi:ribose transport system ATP-binding protein